MRFHIINSNSTMEINILLSKTIMRQLGWPIVITRPSKCTMNNKNRCSTLTDNNSRDNSNIILNHRHKDRDSLIQMCSKFQ